LQGGAINPSGVGGGIGVGHSLAGAIG